MPSLATCANVAQSLTDAKTYTDEEIAELKLYVDQQDAATLAAAKAYTDDSVDGFGEEIDDLGARVDALELHPPVVATRTVLGHVKLATAETYPLPAAESDEVVATPAYVNAAIAAQVEALVVAALDNLTDAFGS